MMCSASASDSLLAGPVIHPEGVRVVEHVPAVPEGDGTGGLDVVRWVTECVTAWYVAELPPEAIAAEMWREDRLARCGE
jgi:hypothetical protein